MMQIQTSEQAGEIYAALAKAQAELENVEKGGSNPHFNSKYATLPDVLSEVRPKLAKHGIYVGQFVVNGEGSTIGVITRLAHGSGQWIESALFVPPAKFDAQGVGSLTTYLRRYTLMAVAGVSGDDDDGNAAVGKPITNGRASSDYGDDYYVPLVSTEERQALMKIADEVGADATKFLAVLGVDSFASIPAREYQRAIALLNKKRQQKAAA